MENACGLRDVLSLEIEFLRGLSTYNQLQEYHSLKKVESNMTIIIFYNPFLKL